MLKTLDLISSSLKGSRVKRKEERRGEGNEKGGKERREEERSSNWYVETVSSRQLNADVWMCLQMSHSSEPLNYCVRLSM